MEEDTDDVGAEDGADIGAVDGSCGDELRFGREEHHLIDSAQEETEERATVYLH